MCTIIHQCWLPMWMRSIPKLTADTVLIFNLAMADFLYCAVALPPMFAMYFCNFKNANCLWLSASQDDKVTFCKVSAFFRYFIAITEWTTLGIMALERCLAIYSFHPRTLHSYIFSPTKTAGICLFLWLMSMTELFNLLNNNYDYNEDTYRCDYISICTEPGDLSNLASPRGIFFVYKSLIPVILIPIGYFLILYQIYFSGQRMKESGTAHTRACMAIRRSQSMKVICRILVVFIICIFPLRIFNIVQTVWCFKEPLRELSITFYCIYWIQYCANNFIYVLSNKKYRFAYKQFLAFVSCSDIPVPTQRVFPPKVGQGMQRTELQFRIC
ncbi:unnamed protein product, partial [Meganyctiphanes norvegica]